MLRANPPPPFSMLYKKEANSRDRKFNIEEGGGGSIVEIRKEICLKYSKMAKCLDTFVAHCSHALKMLYKPPGAVYIASYKEPCDQSDCRKLFVQL